MTRARLLSVSTPESGVWLHALPIANLGLEINDSTIRVVVGLRLGLPLARPHSCCHCSAMVDEFTTHLLSCNSVFFHHSTINSKNSSCFCSCSNPCPPWTDWPSTDRWEKTWCSHHGALGTWQVCCLGFYMPRHTRSTNRAVAVSAPGSVAAQAEMRKIAKYSPLNSTLYSFMPVAIESLGTFSVRTLKFIRDLGRRIALQSGDPIATTYLIQCLAVAIQRGNAASIIGTMGLLADWLSFVFFCFLACFCFVVHWKWYYSQDKKLSC